MRRSGGKRAPLPAGFGTIWTSVALDLVGFGIVIPLLPIYARHYGAHAASAAGLLSAFSAAQFLFAPVWGRVSDRIGRKPVLVLSMAGTAVGSLITGLAGTLWLLYLGRIVDGVSGASVSVAQAAVSDIAEPRERARLLGLLGAAFGVGFVAGPTLGALAALGGPRVPFLVAAALAALNTVVAMRRLPETHQRRREAREVPRPPFSAIADLVALAFVTVVAFSGFEGTFALFGQARLGFREASAAATFAGIGLVLAAVQGGLVRPVVNRLGERGTLRFGLGANAVGLVLLAGVHHWWQLLPALVALIVGQGLVSPALGSLIAGRVDAAHRGGVFGVQQRAGALARVIGPIAAGVLFQQVGVAAPYLIGAALMVAGGLLLVRAPVTEPAAL